jgi:signal peptidase I
MKKKKRRRLLSKYDGKKYAWFCGARECVIILIMVIIAFHLLVGVSRVKGISMEPTLQDGDVVFFVRVGSDYEVGDVVFARMPSGDNYVKRVVAVEGDVVDVRDGILYVNDVPESGSYVKGITEPEEGIVRYPYTVEEGKYFLVGDNREESLDSRSFGALLESQIKGRLLIY